MAETCVCAVCQNAAGNVVGNLFSKILSLISDPITFVLKCNNNVDNLKRRADELKLRKGSADGCVDVFYRRGEEITQELKNWLPNANSLIEAADKLTADAEENAKKKCFFGLCLNPISRYQLSKNAKENSEAIVHLLGKPCDVLERIMEALQSQSSSIIRVHGMPGVGKTMLAKEVKRRAGQDNLFDVVVMALVSKNADSKKIQMEIARGLGLDQLPNGITTQEAADHIKRKLKKMKKVLIILDDIWRPGIDLEELGIPLRNEPKTIEESLPREEHVECKILLTSRDSDVLSHLMDSPLNFSLRQLDSGEAWELLKKIVGDTAESKELHDTAIEIVRRCGGLPLAITTMAKALKNKEGYQWRDALRKLRNPSSENFHGIPAEVYSAIEFSYSHLETKKLQETFLLCCLMGHKASIQDLLKYGVGLGLFAITIEEARDEVFTLISKLKASSLLIDDSDNDYFDMHDLAQDVAVSIARGDRHGLLLTGDHAPRECSDMEAMKDFKWIWLEKANINELPDEFKSQLTLFSLVDIHPSLQIPANFFKGMPRLKVLDMTRMHMSSLPSSICLLQNLHTLCLHHSVLGDIRIIGELKNLEILSLPWAVVEELPREIGQLTRLKLLDLSNCTKLRVIPPRVFANMSRLEELYLRNSFHRWEVQENESQRNAGLAELKHLKKLTNLELTEELHLRELAGVKNVVDELNTEGFPDLKYLNVQNAPEVQHIIKSVEGFGEVLRSLRLQRLPKLSSINKSCRDMPLFFEQVVLPSLEELQLCWMNVDIKWLTSITSFCVKKLKKLIIQGFDNLEFLFSSCVARGMVMLERLEIRECKRMREIIVTENAEEKEILIFPQLNHLSIEDLQNLVAFYLGNCIVEFSSLEDLEVLNCPELKGFTVKFSESTSCIVDIQTLFNEQAAFPNLKRLTITHLNNLEIIWHNKLYANSFCRLISLKVGNCEKLSTVFPCTDILGKILKSLEVLSIYQCGSLEGVFEIVEFNVKQTHAVIDTKFKELNIEGLPRLKHVWNKDPQGILTFHDLKSIKVSYCGSLKNLFPASIGKNLLQLQKLHLYRCGVEEIVTMGEQEAGAIVSFKFPQVTSLKLEVLPRLQCFYPGEHTTMWPMLKEFCFSHFNQVRRADGCGQLDFPVRLPLFSTEKIIPQLEKLSLTRDDIAMICEHESKQDILFNGKVLQIQDYLDDELDVLPVGFLKRFCRLENLIVSYCNFKELFPSKGEVEEQEKHIEIETLSRIKTLNLKCLPYLRHIWSHDSPSVLQNLKTLDIFKCDSLIILSTSISSFQNLTTLNVTSCKGMINVVSVSTAQSLVQLESITVESCHMLTKIVGSERDGMQDYIMITFAKLKFLTLQQLPRLESFCSENFTFKFPRLRWVTVKQCPKLKIFSEGELDTPLLWGVIIKEEDKYRSKDDLNTIIQRTYMEEVGFAGLQLLMLSDFPKFMETWYIKNAQGLLDFKRLQVLEICNCSKFKYLLTHSMAMGLVQLLQLIVKNCGTMEQVIMGEGAENKMEFSHLSLINLESCLDLTSFYVGSHSLELPSLNDFIVKDCPKMVTCAASTSLEEHNKEESQYLFSSKVETPSLEFLSLSSNNIQQILDNSIPKISSYVQNLRKLCVEGCGNLKNLLTSSMVKSFEQLNWLEIRDCHMMEEIILVEESVDEERMRKIFFPNLEFLLLQDLPKLTRFCFGNYLELPCLWKLKISKCPVLKTFISSFIFGDMVASFDNVKNTCALSLFDAKVAFPKLERLIIEHVKSLNKIWNDRLEVNSFCQLTLVSVVSCEKLMNIFPFSMVERLQRLDKLQIWNCDSLEEILESQEPGISQSQAQNATLLPLLKTVTCLEDDVKDEIVFSKLKYLQLCGLPRLSSFCSVKCKFEFPFLEEVILMDCPSMHTFSMDEIRTPKLQKVKLNGDEDEGFWDDNLNSTIQLHLMRKSQGDSEN
ncbi:hypothetical protein SLEP1_g35329 [Rubroshorea leprosula]|uniref:AAA+ ATPase domain-containing protein n=1 Tax=Rubroshorea leprosula TaxID=152421 RepID=A0AAV5KMT2_9ROSI|nr:hypothetical protein SLEP1_g35329 [Rubroshorea leprosula]